MPSRFFLLMAIPFAALGAEPIAPDLAEAASVIRGFDLRDYITDQGGLKVTEYQEYFGRMRNAAQQIVAARQGDAQELTAMLLEVCGYPASGKELQFLSSMISAIFGALSIPVDKRLEYIDLSIDLGDLNAHFGASIIYELLSRISVDADYDYEPVTKRLSPVIKKVQQKKDVTESVIVSEWFNVDPIAAARGVHSLLGSTAPDIGADALEFIHDRFEVTDPIDNRRKKDWPRLCKLIDELGSREEWWFKAASLALMSEYPGPLIDRPYYKAMESSGNKVIRYWYSKVSKQKTRSFCAMDVPESPPAAP